MKDRGDNCHEALDHRSRDHRRISKPRSANSAPRLRVAALSEAEPSSNHNFLLRQGQRVKEGLHRGFAEAPAALMRSPLVVLDEPSIEIDLQLVDRPVDILWKATRWNSFHSRTKTKSPQTNGTCGRFRPATD
jgi:hypothetical protein